MFEASRRHQLHADANAEKRPAIVDHGLDQRRVHAGNGREPLAAIREGSNPRQYDAFGAPHDVGIVGHENVAADIARLARRAFEGFHGGVEIAGAVIDNGCGQTRGSSLAPTGGGGGGGGGATAPAPRQLWKNMSSASSAVSPMTTPLSL